MDISWAAIGKIMLTGIATYVVFPAALILRDYVLKKFIDYFILNKKLRKCIRMYATRINIWNTSFAIKTSVSVKDGETKYLVDGKAVTRSQYHEYNDSRDKLANFIDEDRLYIQRKYNFLTWLLKHYKQDSINPIDDWLKDDIERMKGKG